MEFGLKELVGRALAEDLGLGDVTTRLTVPPDRLGQAAIVARKPLVLSGLSAALAAFELVDPALSVKTLAADGDELSAGSEVLTVGGLAASILTAERVALNFLGRLSGVASLTAKYVKAVRLSGSGAKILDTRKTTPGLRALEKAAVRHGGGHNHRFCLGDGILIKDNHIRACGSVALALAGAKAQAPHPLRIEIEVDDLAQLKEALKGGADAVLLDNMTPVQLHEAMAIINGFFRPGPRNLLVEASGGVNLETVGDIAATGVDFVSVGALTHSAPAADLGLDWS
ncbi:MAG: carboxylating nicotinate-nucleotide diphosphorylase [Deltaproteobacteria bacterium]|jgi:nicotinate-nucleotide pyrophosphorylase (carboxylating)|nr:carboxylating nicotinate-nucleotide diphosphorylase [Deltaproteobacteria bacterium]